MSSSLSQRRTPPAVAVPHVATTDGALGEFFRGLVAVGIPEARKPEPPEPCPRVWVPNLSGARTKGYFLGRHPELAWAFEDLKARRMGRRRGRGHRRGIRGKFPSKLQRRKMHSTSDLEFDAFRAFELDPAATRFIEQPLRLRFRLHETWRVHTPDLYVEYGDRAEFIEVKFEREASQAEERWKAIGETLSGLGYGYRVLTERHLRAEPLYSNIERIFRARHARLPASVADALSVLMERRGPSSIATLVAEFGVTERNVLYLIRVGVLATNLGEAPLGSATTVWLRSTRRP
jgi:hypothetical protein